MEWGRSVKVHEVRGTEKGVNGNEKESSGLLVLWLHKLFDQISR